MRCARAVAYTSFCGFQSLSKIMTTSAAVRLIPYPPALVESKKTSLPFVTSLKRSIEFYLSRAFTCPSIFSYLTDFHLRNSSIKPSIYTNWLNISTFRPSSLNLPNSFSSRIIFPLLSTSTLQYSSTVKHSLVSSCCISLTRNGWLQHFRNCISRLLSWVALAAD